MRTWLVDVATTTTVTKIVHARDDVEAIRQASDRYEGDVIGVTEVAECTRCGGMADLGASRKRHRAPGCRGKWSA